MSCRGNCGCGGSGSCCGKCVGGNSGCSTMEENPLSYLGTLDKLKQLSTQELLMAGAVALGALWYIKTNHEK